jgi:hypothetical protein
MVGRRAPLASQAEREDRESQRLLRGNALGRGQAAHDARATIVAGVEAERNVVRLEARDGLGASLYDSPAEARTARQVRRPRPAPR